MRPKSPRRTVTHEVCPAATSRTRVTRRASPISAVAAAAVGVLALSVGPAAYGQILWSTATGTAWLNASNWVGGAVPTATQIAEFGANPNTLPVGVGINFAATTNAGTQVNGQRIQAVGAIQVSAARTAAMLVGNSSVTAGAAGRLQLNGATVNGIDNVVLRNASNQTLTLQNAFNNGNQLLTVVLGSGGEHIVTTEGTGDVLVSSTLSGSATGSALTFAAAGTGTLRLSGSNNYAGGTHVRGLAGSALNVDAVNALPRAGAVVVTEGGRLNLNVAGSYGAAGQVLSLAPSQTTLPALASASGITATWAGDLAINADANLTANGAAGTLTFSGNASGAGALVKQGPGTLVLAGAANTLTGPTVLNSGTLTVAPGSFMSTGPLTMSQVGSAPGLVLNNAAQTIGSLSSQFSSLTGFQAQTITLNGTALTVNQTTDGTFGYGAVTSLTSYITGPGSLIKACPATLTLTAANFFTGPVVVRDGTLSLASDLNPTNITVSGTGTSTFVQPDGNKAAVQRVVLGVSAGQSGSYVLLGGNLSAPTVTVGLDGDGVFNQSGITFNTSNFFATLLDIASGANSTGVYNLSGGRMIVSNANVGVRGTGAFNQSGGTNGVSGTLVLAAQSGSTGRYTLSAGSLIATNAYVGNSGQATFTQTGGTFASALLVLGGVAGGTGTYDFSAGQLTTTQSYVGLAGAGLLTQTGGTHTASGTLALAFGAGSQGYYSLTNARLATAELVVGNLGIGTLEQFSGTVSVTGNLLLGNLSGSSGIQTLSGGRLSASNSYVGTGDTGTFSPTGGTHAVTGDLFVGLVAGGRGLYALQEGRLSAVNVFVGQAGRGTFTQSGGVNNPLRLYLGVSAGATGTYSLDAGQFVSFNTVVANLGTGTFTQTGGTHIPGFLTVGSGPGSRGLYALASGALDSTFTTVGDEGSGTFTQSGGTQSVAESTVLGFAPVGVGTYTLSAGAFTSKRLTVGFQGKGTFAQTGGTHTVTTDLVLADTANSSGTYTLSAGTAAASNSYVGNFGSAKFTQTGGTFTSERITLGAAAGGSGEYQLSGGSLTVSSLFDVGGAGGTGVFNQSGASALAARSLYVAGLAGSSGTYTLSAGNLTTIVTSVGEQGTGLFYQSGGTHTAGAVFVANEAGSGRGAYVLSGGLLTTDILQIGRQGGATFTQTGGTVTATQYTSLGLGVSAGGTDTYTLSGGSLTTPALILGTSGQARFQQTGGTFTVTGSTGDFFTVARNPGSAATYSLSGGLLRAPAITGYDGTPVFDFNGGTLAPTGSTPALFVDFSPIASAGGAVIDTAAYNVTLATGLLHNPALGPTRDGGLTKSGPGTLTLASPSTFTGPLTVLDGTLAVTGNLTPYSISVAPAPAPAPATAPTATATAAVVHSSGVVTVPTSLDLASNPGSAATYTLSGGSLSTSNSYVGFAGSGTFTQTGGTHAVSNVLRIAEAVGSFGTYSLAAGQLGTSATYVGYRGTGTFVQTGGTHTVAAVLELGSINTNAVGEYRLFGGTVSSASTAVGVSGAATFTQSGGTHTTGRLSVSFVSGTGLYTLADGNLNTTNSFVGDGIYPGTFVQSGGAHNVSALLSLGDAASETGSYDLSAGTLSTSNTYVGNSGRGDFSQSGGTHLISTFFSIGRSPGGTGRYLLSGGAVTGSGMSLGSGGTGTFTQTGGTVNFGSPVFIGSAVGGNGLYTLSDGTLSLDSLILGFSGTGRFEQTGGTVSIARDFSLSEFPTATGIYILSGGSLYTRGLDNNGGTSVFDFNGGTLSLTGSTSSLAYRFSPVVSAGGAVIDTAGYDATLDTALLHNPALGATPDRGLTKAGPGTLTLAAANTYTGPTAVNAGTLRLTGTLNTGAITVAITVAGNATLDLARPASTTAVVRTLDGNALALLGTPGATAVARATTPTATPAGRSALPTLTVLSSLSITGDAAPLGSRAYFGLLDLGTNDLVVLNAPPSTLPALRDLARAYLATNGLNGLGSSSPIPFTRLAVFPNTTSNPAAPYFTTFDGLPVSTTDVLVRFTYVGDANLDGTVNGQDLVLLLEGLTTAGTGWNRGDFNYDGVVNGTDLALFNAASAANLPALGSPADLSSSPGGTVPEPAGLCPLFTASLLLSRRRRRG